MSNNESKRPFADQVLEYAGVQVGDIYEEGGHFFKILHIRDTDDPYPLLALEECHVHTYINEEFIHSSCTLVERGGQVVEQWVPDMVSNIFFNIGDMYGDDHIREIVHLEGEYAMCRHISDVDNTSSWCTFYIGNPLGKLRFLK